MSKSPHPEMKSSPCHKCGNNSTKDYDCVDCKKSSCGVHMNWSWKTDSKWRCSGCFETHNKNKGVSYK